MLLWQSCQSSLRGWPAQREQHPAEQPPQTHCFFTSFFSHHFYSPAQPVRSCTLSDLLDKNLGHRRLPFSPRVHAFIFIAHRIQLGHFTVFLCLSLFVKRLLTHALELFASQFVEEKVSTCICPSRYSMMLESTKLASEATRLTLSIGVLAPCAVVYINDSFSDSSRTGIRTGIPRRRYVPRRRSLCENRTKHYTNNAACKDEY